jgi:hypothetical protein
MNDAHRALPRCTSLMTMALCMRSIQGLPNRLAYGPSPSGRLPDGRSHQSAKSGTDEHRRLFARIANLDGVAARDWTIAADDALRLNATSMRSPLWVQTQKYRHFAAESASDIAKHGSNVRKVPIVFWIAVASRRGALSHGVPLNRHFNGELQSKQQDQIHGRCFISRSG